MFIKSAYEDRLQKESDELTASLPHSHAKAQPKIGSVKNTRINYDKDEHFFSKDDVPWKAQTVAQQVKEEIDPDFLGLRKKPWNTSAFVPKNPLAEETFERKMIKIKLGMFDHQIPKYKEPMIYDGCETRDYYSGIYARNLERKTKKAMSFTKKKQDEIIKNYKTGIDRQNELIMQLREEKYNDKEIRDQIKEEYRFQNPSASDQKTDAAVFRIAYEKKHLKQFDFKTEFGITDKTEKTNKTNKTGKIDKTDKTEKEKTWKPFYPDLSKTLKQKIIQKYYHSGVWQSFKAQPKIKLDPLSSSQKPREDSRDIQDGKTFEAWSCCMNQEKDSEGCCLVKVDKNRWNYESIKHY